MVKPIEWKSVKDELPKECGWYIVAINPKKFTECCIGRVNEWRSKFGFTKAWYNSDSNGKWYEPDPHGNNSESFGDRVTHWDYLPPVPRYNSKEYK